MPPWTGREEASPRPRWDRGGVARSLAHRCHSSLSATSQSRTRSRSGAGPVVYWRAVTATPGWLQPRPTASRRGSRGCPGGLRSPACFRRGSPWARSSRSSLKASSAGRHARCAGRAMDWRRRFIGRRVLPPRSIDRLAGATDLIPGRWRSTSPGRWANPLRRLPWDGIQPRQPAQVFESARRGRWRPRPARSRRGILPVWGHPVFFSRSPRGARQLRRADPHSFAARSSGAMARPSGRLASIRSLSCQQRSAKEPWRGVGRSRPEAGRVALPHATGQPRPSSWRAADPRPRQNRGRRRPMAGCDLSDGRRGWSDPRPRQHGCSTHRACEDTRHLRHRLEQSEAQLPRRRWLASSSVQQRGLPVVPARSASRPASRHRSEAQVDGSRPARAWRRDSRARDVPRPVTRPQSGWERQPVWPRGGHRGRACPSRRVRGPDEAHPERGFLSHCPFTRFDENRQDRDQPRPHRGFFRHCRCPLPSRQGRRCGPLAQKPWRGPPTLPGPSRNDRWSVCHG